MWGRGGLPPVCGDIPQGRLPRPRRSGCAVRQSYASQRAQGRQCRVCSLQGRRQDGTGDGQPGPRPCARGLGLSGLQAVRLAGRGSTPPWRLRQLRRPPLGSASTGRRRSASRSARAKISRQPADATGRSSTANSSSGRSTGDVHCLSAATGESCGASRSESPSSFSRRSPAAASMSGPIGQPHSASRPVIRPMTDG